MIGRAAGARILQFRVRSGASHHTRALFLGLAVLNAVLVVTITLSSRATLLAPFRLPARLVAVQPPPALPPSCELCVLNATDPLCRYGIDSVRMSRSYEGSGFRVRRFLEKALRGEAVRVGVIGASVSMGHGVAHLGRPTWHKIFMADFDSMFPTATLHLGLAGGADSDFFSHCYKALIADDLDLYIIEVDINNSMRDKTIHDDDDLYRALLSLPQQPAVIRVSALANEMARGAMSGIMQSQWFDVPVISIRNILIPHFMLHPSSLSTYFSSKATALDMRHISYAGHQMLGDMVSIYLREQLCETRRRLLFPPPAVDWESGWPSGDALGLVPRLHAWDKFDPATTYESATPTCFLTTSKTHPLQPLYYEGQWTVVEWNDKAAWNSFTPGSRISFEFEGTQVGIFMWQTNGVGNAIQPGCATTWVDELEVEQTVDAFSQRENAGTAWVPLFQDLEPGKHILHIEILQYSSTKGNDFRIVGLASL